MGNGARCMAAEVRNLESCGFEGGPSLLRGWVNMVATIGHKEGRGDGETRGWYISAGAWPVESGMTGGGYLVYLTKEEMKGKNDRML